MRGVVVEVRGERASRIGEVFTLLRVLYHVARAVVMAMLAYLVWGAATIVVHAATIYKTCGYIYWEVNGGILPRCMRELVDSRYWLDLVR